MTKPLSSFSSSSRAVGAHISASGTPGKAPDPGSPAWSSQQRRHLQGTKSSRSPEEERPRTRSDYNTPVLVCKETSWLISGKSLFPRFPWKWGISPALPDPSPVPEPPSTPRLDPTTRAPHSHTPALPVCLSPVLPPSTPSPAHPLCPVLPVLPWFPSLAYPVPSMLPPSFSSPSPALFPTNCSSDSAVPSSTPSPSLVLLPVSHL